MSVKELKLITEQGHTIGITYDGKEIEFEVNAGEIVYFWLDHNQAHLLKLWLEEHLK